MCLAIPMKIVEMLPDGAGVADLDGVRHDVNLSLVPGTGLGDYVVVHAGFAIERLNEAEAEAVLSVFDELAATQPPGGGISTPLT